MFHPSPQHISFRQQVISLAQNYPCPRCAPGIMEPLGYTETFKCNTCKRAFVPLKGGRFLYPARHLGHKIAPTYWWDGYRWHFAGTTASGQQLTSIACLSCLPVIGFNMAVCLDLINSLPSWVNPIVASPIIGLISLQLLFIFFWDFELFHSN